MIRNRAGEGLFLCQTGLCSHRLRRYSHNRITESSQMMAGETLNGGNRRTTYFVLSILLVSSLPMFTTVSAEDQGTPSELQAQDISVSFDNVSETTTITWRNIEQTGGDLDLYSELWDATYHVYRHDVPITPANIGDLNPWHSVTACDKSTIGQNPLSCRGQGGSNPHPGHSATCLLYTSPSPRDQRGSRMPSSA